MMRLMRNTAAAVLAAVITVSAASCGNGSGEPSDSTHITTVGTTAAPEETTAVTETAVPQETEPPMAVDIPERKLTEMKEKLISLAWDVPDLYGWIVIDNTDISYPLVQGTDNDYYLNRSPYKQWQDIGSIFVDYRNRSKVEDSYNYNIVIYGHNLTWGGMFHDVQRIYENEALFRSSYIYIYTFDGVFVYEPFSIYEANAYYQYFRTHFDAPEEFVDFANEMKSNSIYMEEDVEFTGDDRMITLSTCTNTHVDGRYAFHAKLVQVTRW